MATCPLCESDLLIGIEDMRRLTRTMKKERFGKVMLFYDALYYYRAYRFALLRRTRLYALYARWDFGFLFAENAI